MRQLYFAFLLCTTLINAQTLEIRDANFENVLIELGYDSGNPDGLIAMENMTQVSYLDISGKGIKDLSGIEAFTNLEVLIADENDITSLDISQNTNLKEVSVYNNKLSSINVSNNAKLEKLNVYNNRLSELVLYNNRNLTYLAAADNNLLELDLVNNKQLEKLYCQNNQLTSLDVSNSPLLEIINAEYNNLSALNVDNSPELVQITASNNNLSGLNTNTNPSLQQINVLYNSITDLDLSSNTALYAVLVAYNKLESLNIRNGNNANFQIFRAEGNPGLNCITADDDIVSDNAKSVTGRWNMDFDANFSANCVQSANDNAIEEVLDRTFSFFIGNDKTLNINSDRKASLNIINLQGVAVVSRDLNEGENTIPLGNALSNVYVLQINSEIGTFTKKILLK
ncbi:T9SS type A sorting domain-containing protein [Leptobacterium flavescens]|uniref:T9SS type A sorting domain-containing protein n=1 Tax=Leptobacterium flavescens TaxID=472055 RepID=A0A6P0UTQ2_9FLAO|nr:T9SS type A sorting domain-containing protein [Leptobacterium flavescens]NER14223.1 T9SS type A sorting domain-containing protein [Leptobacterium flavescens]